MGIFGEAERSRYWKWCHYLRKRAPLRPSQARVEEKEEEKSLWKSRRVSKIVYCSAGLGVFPYPQPGASPRRLSSP